MTTLRFILYLFGLLLALDCIYGALNSLGGHIRYLEDVKYIYQFQSNSTLAKDIDMKLNTEVAVYLLSESNNWQDLNITITSPVVTWHTLTGEFKDESIFANTAKWFTVRQASDGTINSVSYPTDKHSVISLKKSLAQILSINKDDVKNVKKKPHTNGVSFVHTYSVKEKAYEKQMRKEFVISQNGEVVSVDLTEVILPLNGQASGLLNTQMSSHSRLVLLDTVSVPNLHIDWDNQDSIVTETPAIVPPLPSFVPLDSVYSDVIKLLSCTEYMLTCQKEAVTILNTLSVEDLSSLMTDMFQHTEWTSSDTTQALTFTDVLVKTTLSTTISDKLLETALNNNNMPDVIARRILFHFTTSLVPTENSVRKVMAFVQTAKPGKDIKEKALLALGSMSHYIRNSSPTLSSNVTQFLHDMLEDCISTISSVESQPCSLMTIINSISNAADNASMDIVKTHAYGINKLQDLRAQLAALRALSHHQDSEVADTLEEIAETTLHPQIQQTAASAYMKHSMATKDLSHLLKRSFMTPRSRRNINNAESLHYNVTMPSVNWGLSFGDDNITVDMSRNVLNSFDIVNDPFSTEYIISIRDEATFQTSLSLSSGQQTSKFLQTELCLDGTVTYDVNMETDYHHLTIVSQFDELQSVVDDLILQFESAYKSMKDSETLYETLKSDFSIDLDMTESQLQQTSQHLKQFTINSEGILNGNNLILDAIAITSNINASYTDAIKTIEESRESLMSTLESVLPLKLDAFLHSLLKDDQPFTVQSELVPYLKYAPQTALAGIYDIYWESGKTLIEFELSINEFIELTSKYGQYSAWTNPYLTVWSIENSIDELLIDIELEKENAIDDGIDTTELQSLSKAISDNLKPALNTLINAANDVHEMRDDLLVALRATLNGYDEFTKGYEASRSAVDRIFGQRFYPTFPNEIRSCDSDIGCGTYPTTSGDKFRDGIDLTQKSSEPLISPFAGYVSLFDSNSIDNALNYNYSTDNAILLTPTEFSLDSFYFVISNMDPYHSFNATPIFVTAGEVIGTLIDDTQGVHVEAYKTLDNKTYTMNPTQFVSPVLKPKANVVWDCNEITTIVNGMVVDTQTIAESVPIEQSIGDSLVTIDVNDEEFPQPYDLVLDNDIGLSSAENVEFFQSSTFLMVGVIPVTFSFSAHGQYNVNMSLYAALLSRNININVTPEVWGEVEGYMKVGDATYATVNVDGLLLNASLPLTIDQDYGSWPLSASSNMDLILHPTSLNMTTQLIQRVGVGILATETVLETNIPWSYDIPDVNIDNEFYYIGTHTDETPPVFTTLQYSIDDSYCSIRQVSNRDYSDPAFEIEFELEEAEGLENVQLMIGTYKNGDDVLSKHVIRGERLVLSDQLSNDEHLIATVLATNRNKIQSFAHCVLDDYDLSPPQARVVPFSDTTSHPKQFQVLLALFDEYGLTEDMELAVGTTIGEKGNDLLDWITLKTNRVNEVIDEEKFSFPRNGRLIEDIISVMTEIDDHQECSSMCEDHIDCLSYDYSQSQERCILHSNIEGPTTLDSDDFVNTFETLPLQISKDFVHYEALGKGHVTMYTLSGLELQQGQMFFINLKLQNKLGYTNIVSSTSVLVDMTPPTPGRLRNTNDTLQRKECGDIFNIEYVCGGETTTINNHRIIYDGEGSDAIFNGPTPLYNALYTKANNFITANWDGIEDRESGLLAYTWCISSSNEYNCDILEQKNPHGTVSEQERWTNTGLARFSDILVDGDYYITIDAINKVGYGGSLVTTIHHTTPFTLDTTPPIVQYLTIVEYDIEKNVLSVQFSVSDSGSGMKEVSISVGTTSDNTDILPWTLIDTLTFVDTTAVLSVVVPDGINGLVKLRAINNVDLQTIMTSTTPISIDRSPPTIGTLNDGSSKDSNVNYQSDTKRICANWEGVFDPHSGISSFLWGVGTSQNNYNTVPLRNVTDEEISNSIVCEEDDVTLEHGMVYYSSLITTNGADEPLTTITTSDGVMIDITPPDAGNVLDGGSPDIQYSHSLTTLSASWNGFEDSESGIDRYTVEVKRMPLGLSEFVTVLTDYTVTGTSYFGNHFNFVNGDKIVVRVTGFNGAGQMSFSESDGYKIDLTAPEITTLQDGLNPASDIDYIANNNNYSVNWVAFDDESDISSIEIALFHLSAGKKTRVFPDTLSDSITEHLDDSSVTSYTIQKLQLVQGYKYVAVVTFTNGAGLKSSFETNGATVDLVSPVMHNIVVLGDTYLDDDDNGDGISMIGSHTQVEASWEGSDDSSGIIEFSLSIVNEQDTVVQPGYFTFDGQIATGRISGLDLTVGNENSGPFYRMRVTATDNAGQESQPLYSETFWISGEVYAGAVYDGYYPFDDIDYTNELSSISTYFNGFFSQQCGGIVQYQWAIGHGDDDKTSVLSYTEAGMVVVGNGSGYAQLLLPDLHDSQTEELFITVRGITGCGDILESTSNGFTIDSSPPIINIHDTSHKAVENISSNSSYQTEQTFSSIWTVTEDSGESIDHVTVSIGSYPGGKDLTGEMKVDADHIREDIVASEGVPSYVTVSATNRAGLETVQYSKSVVMDTSSPEMEFIKCSHSNEVLTQFSCYWDAIDSESGIDYLIISLASDRYDEDRITSTKLSRDQCSFAFNFMNYSPDQGYYVTLYAYNGAGLENIITSEPVYIDTTPPVSEGSLYVLPNFGDQSYTDESGSINTTSEAFCVWDTDVLTLRFSKSSDEESIVNEYQLGIGHFSGSGDVVAFHTIDVEVVDDTWGLYVLSGIDSVYSETRNPYYFTVRSFNSAGLYYDIVSMPVYVKSEGNTEVSWVIDGDTGTVDRDYQYSSTQASGRAFFGINCPMRMVEWSVEGIDGIIAKNFTEIDLETAQYTNNTYSFITDQVMYEDETYRLIVRGIDYTGQVHVMKSDGILVTKRPLSPGTVVEGTPGLLQLNYQESLSTLTINYYDFGDGTSEQEIEYYEVALGTDKQHLITRSDIVPFTNVELATSYTFTGLDLIPLTQTYFATVRAYAVSGAFVDFSSNGIVVGLTHSIKPGIITQTPYQSNSSFLSAYWNGFESDVAITKYEWALGTSHLNYTFLQSLCTDRTNLHDSDFKVFGFKDVGTDTYVIEYNLDLQHGLKYYITLRVTDQSDKCISVSSAVPTVIDKTVPVVKDITIGPKESRVNLPIENEYIAYLIDAEALTVLWEDFVDLESEIETYEVGFFKLDACSSNLLIAGTTTVDYIDVGLVNEFKFEDLKLDINISYVAKIRATNQAGLKVVGSSNPVMIDTNTLTAGEVKDGSNWESDLVFQSDLTKLSGVISLSYFQPQSDFGVPCPSNKFYSFETSHIDWSSQPFTEFNGLKSSAIRYQTDAIDFSSNKMTINSRLKPTENLLVSGAYFTTLSDLSGQKTISMSVSPALGDSRLQKYIVTSILILETSNQDLLVEYDPTVPSESPSIYKALGLQIHTQGSTIDSQQLILWSKDDSDLSMVKTVTQEVSLNISESLEVRFEFSYEDHGLVRSRKVAVYIDDILRLALYDIPQFTASSKLILHAFNREGYLPECVIDTCVNDPPLIMTSFSHVSLPSESNGACSYGSPFYSWGSPLTEVKAGIGTSIDIADIKPLEVVFVPCRPCIPTPCHLYGCDETCPTSDDPQTVTFSFAHLSLSPFHNETQSFSGSGSGDDEMEEEDIDGYFNIPLKPAVYYIIVEATSASGQTTHATSNGITIDVTPPIQNVPIRLYDAEFSLSQSSNYQGNNHTISASWGFQDLESGIKSYEWSIGTTPFGEQIQKFVNVGLISFATNSDLEGILMHNETYYVTVRAMNGAGLYSEVSSTGITHLSIELNETNLNNGIVIESFEAITDINNISLYIVNTEVIGLLITSIREDVAEISWGLGSHIDQESLFYDIFPLTDITSGESASIDQYTFYIDGLPHSNVSDILALSDGVDSLEISGLYIEPGRIFYHVVQFCDLAHSCIQSSPRESILIRTSDVSLQSVNGENLNITIFQSVPMSVNSSVLDSNHSLTVMTSGGLQKGTWVFAGFLSEQDVTRVYHVQTPYISNPYLTMDLTSRELARRFSSVGGPSFFISFFGQDALEGELIITTSFDSSVNWTESVPRLAYWDIDNSEWREVEDTCGGSVTAVNWTTHTLSVEMCSTIVDGVYIDNRPSSLSRRKRNIDSESGSGSYQDYLERPIQFIVIERGNVSSNTPPTLVLDTLVTLNEDETLTYQIPYEDQEKDEVLFYLTSIPKLGTAVVDSVSGLLTYTPCENCFGYDVLDIYIQETNLIFGEELDTRGTLQLYIANSDDKLVSFLFESTLKTDMAIWPDTSIDVYVEANRTGPVSIARMGVYDYDGYEDDIETYVTAASEGISGYTIWLDVVSVPESLPVDWSGYSIGNFTGYVSFLGVDVTFLPSNPDFIGTDKISVYAIQENKIATPLLEIAITVIPSWCLNNGVCGGSLSDPDCTNITNRMNNPGDYSCNCSSEYSGSYCQESILVPGQESESECPGNIPKMDCNGNPCDGAACPGYVNAECVPDYCGHCRAVWYLDDEIVQCSASDENICLQPLINLIEINPTACDNVACDCPSQAYECPDDSIFIETRNDQCCVTYTCQCPDISCPLLMDSSKKVMPQPDHRGGKYSGRCCPSYTFSDINECLESDLNMCSDYCTNEEPSYSCSCDEGVTLSSNGHSCGVCAYNEMDYLYGDRVKIGCNWCTCQADDLSGERWHCTSQSCDPSCYYNGITYTIDSLLTMSSVTCSCKATDTFAEWQCQFNL